MPWASETGARQPPIKAAAAGAMADSRSQPTEESADQCEYRHNMGYPVGAVHAVRPRSQPLRSLRGLRQRPQFRTQVASAAAAPAAAVLHDGLRLRLGELVPSAARAHPADTTSLCDSLAALVVQPQNDAT